MTENTEVDILTAVLKLNEIEAATATNILNLARDMNCNVTRIQVKGTLLRGIKDGYLCKNRRVYTLVEKTGRAKKGNSEASCGSQSCLKTRKRRKTSCQKEAAPCKKRRRQTPMPKQCSELEPQDEVDVTYWSAAAEPQETFYD